jgi:3',5'-cyclic AMP phosphodiesterase CpdA
MWSVGRSRRGAVRGLGLGLTGAVLALGCGAGASERSGEVSGNGPAWLGQPSTAPATSGRPAPATPRAGPAAGVTVAFIADGGANANTDAVLRLIRAEGADIVVHAGDLDYEDDPPGWDRRVTRVLGARFPYLVAIGNHDAKAWPGYRAVLARRVARATGLACRGDLGVASVCTFRGLRFLLAGPDIRGSGHAAFLAREVAASPSRWNVCVWHKTQRAMQVGGKRDEAGWEVYEACRQGGAIVATGHEHTYARTKTLVDTRTQAVDPSCAAPAAVCVGKGRTFVFHSGLGGASIRDQERCKPVRYPYGCRHEWATIYTEDQGARFGALFITFDPAARRATGYFKNVEGRVVDRFTVTVDR